MVFYSTAIELNIKCKRRGSKKVLTVCDMFKKATQRGRQIIDVHVFYSLLLFSLLLEFF